MGNINTPKPYALIYCRVSSERQVTEGHGLESQEKRCRDFARANGYEVVKVFRDEGVSGAILERPGIDALLKYMDDHAYRPFIVIIDDIKRFARDVQVHLVLKKAIEGRNGQLKSPNFTFEDSPMGEAIEIIFAAVAGLERSENRRQVIQKMHARLSSGYWSFGPPAGMINRRDPVRGKVLVAQEPIASVYKEAIELYAQDRLNTIKEVRDFIRARFRQLGLKRSISATITRVVLSNPLYAGYLHYPKWDIPLMKAQHEGFISYDTYRRVQDKLEGRSKPRLRADYSTDFSLRGFVLCNECGKPLTASWNKGRSKRYANYHCKNPVCPKKGKSLNRDIMEDRFLSLLDQVKPDKAYLKLAEAVLKDVIETRKEKANKEVVQTMKEEAALEREIRSLIEKISNTTRPEIIPSYEEIVSEKQGRLSEIRRRREQISRPGADFGTALSKVTRVLEEPVLLWWSDNVEQKRTVLYMMFDERLRYDKEDGFGTARLARPIELMKELADGNGRDVEMPGIEPGSE